MSKHTFFNLKKPCANCPFLKSNKGVRGLGKSRAISLHEEIAGHNQATFSCHKTVKRDTDYDETEGHDEAEDRRFQDKEQMCAGVMLLLHNTNQLKGYRPFITGKILGLLDENVLDKSYAPFVFDNWEQFIDAQSMKNMLTNY